VRRLGEVSDIVEAVLYLQSAGFVTGENLRVDGGVFFNPYRNNERFQVG
jgi:NAD(P)-dependent dehydrogenase (short-subunit alcohol dehydrogenase family)